MKKYFALPAEIHLFIASGVFMLSSYLISIWLGRLLGPAAYGLYGVIISLMTAVNIIQTSGLPQATSKFIASSPPAGGENVGAVLKASLYIQILSTLAISAVFFLLAWPIAYLLNDLSLVPYLRATSLILPCYGVFSLYVGYYNGLRNFKRQAFINSAYGVAKLVLVVGLVYVFHIYGAIAGFVLAPIVALLFGFKFPRSSAPTQSLIWPLIIFSLPLIGFAALSTLIISIDLFFVKSLVADVHAAGLYTAAQNIARIPYFALSAFALIIYPTVSRSMFAEDVVRTGERIYMNLRYLLLLLIPGTVLIAATSTGLLHLLYGTAYLAASPTLAALAVSFGLVTLFVLLANVLNAAHKGTTSVLITAVGLFVTIIASLALIPPMGLIGGAVATGLGGIVALVAAGVVVVRTFPSAIPWRTFLAASLASIPLGVIPLLLDISIYLLPLLYAVLGVIYIVILVLLREITVNDFKALKSALPNNTATLPPE